MRSLLVVPRLPGLSTQLSIPPQVPLGHVLVGSQLQREGHDVFLVDGAAENLSARQIAVRAKSLRAQMVWIGHPASTVGHGPCMDAARAIKSVLPRSLVLYGGVFPTFSAERCLAESQESIDFVVTHEAELSAAAIARCIAAGGHPGTIAGVISRDSIGGGGPHVSPEVVQDLDAVAPAWGDSWKLPGYRAFGLPSCTVQFSRGCVNRCSYCGQWEFWRTWRHRSVLSFVDEIARLSRAGVRLFWVADENWGIDQALFLELLRSLRNVNRGHHFVVAMECSHVVRDREQYRLYAEAGVSVIMLGVDDGRAKGFPDAEPRAGYAGTLARCIEDLRRDGIVCIVNHFANPGPGSELGEIPLDRLGADFYNAVFPTPHGWTPYGQEMCTRIASPDLTNWDYRHPVLGSSRRDLAAQFWRAKWLELRLNVPALWRTICRRPAKRNALVARLYLLAILAFAVEVVAGFWDAVRLCLGDREVTKAEDPAAQPRRGKAGRQSSDREWTPTDSELAPPYSLGEKGRSEATVPFELSDKTSESGGPGF